ncbi:hypothetical protein [Actinoplanes sp. NPDC051411]|uniref:hypothetical protein n=1 Tax=Actinoplanes sp. NPDC051411 TaxID=3155522 RepID=UPI00341CE9B4
MRSELCAGIFPAGLPGMWLRSAKTGGRVDDVVELPDAFAGAAGRRAGEVQQAERLRHEAFGGAGEVLKLVDPRESGGWRAAGHVL